MFNLAECAASMNNIDKNDMYYNNVPPNKDDTMSFLGTLSPAGSSVDSTDVKMDQISSPINNEYNSVLQMMENFVTDLDKPFLRIIEEPVEKFRFRYKSEMAGTHGSLIGMSSDKIRKSTYPAVQLEQYDGKAIIRCSIYQIKDDEPHAHRLVMKADHGEKDDPHDIEVSPERGFVATFKGMGIIHTAKKYLASELYKKLYKRAAENLQRQRLNKILTKSDEAEIKHQAEIQSKIINLNIVRLKFEAFSEIVYGNVKYYLPLCPPVYSQGINNLKSALTGELKIVRLDHTTASCVGGQEIFILVEKVTKNNIKVRFFECDEDDNESWVDYGRFSPNDVHHQYAIVFKVPPYKDLNIEEPVNVCMQLERPTDGARSEPRTFKYKPSDKVGKKRTRYCESVPSGELPTTINPVSFGSFDSIPDEILGSLTFDFLKNTDNINSNEFDEIVKRAGSEYESLCIDGCASASASDSDYDKRYTENDILYSRICKKAVNNLTALVKQTPSSELLEKVVEKLFKDFRAPDGNNALHCAIFSEHSQHLRYILVLISKMKHLNIPNIQNDKKQTALHVAVHVNDPTIVRLLLPVAANPNITDNNGDTPLNLAVKNNYNLDEYTQLVDKTDLELECYGGYTPLHSAIKNGNLKSVKVLVEKNADVNHKIPSSGYTALHLAIEQKNTEIVRFLLENTEARVDVENHSKVTPVHLAKILLTEGEDSKLIFNIISDYAKNRGFESLMIKEEPVYDSCSEDSDEVINTLGNQFKIDFSSTKQDLLQYNLEIKLEPNSSVPMHTDYDENDLIRLKNSLFTKECIAELAKVLDGSEVLAKLSKDIHFEEIQNSLSTTTNLIFNYAYVTGISVLVIRDLLTNYGADEAVKIIDSFYLKK